MAADRLLPVSTTPGAVIGDDYMDAVQEEVTGLWDRSICQLTGVSGTNTITASCEVPLTGSLIDGMRFILVPAATTTSQTVTLNIQTLGAKTVVDSLGLAPAVGALKIGGKYLIEYDQPSDKFWVISFLPPTGFDDRPSFRNIMGDNGGFKIWQRAGTMAVAASNPGAYCVDRWYVITNANQATTISRGTIGDRSQFCCLVQRNSGQTGVGSYVFSYPLTTEELSRIRGAKVTLSFRAIAGANFSPTSGTVNYALYVGTGAEGKRGAGFTSETTVLSASINVTGSVQSTSTTSAAVVPTNATQGEFRATWTPTGTAGANDWVAFDSVQLESGVLATEFEYAPFGYCLAQCQRFFAKTFPYATAPAQSQGLAGALSSDKDLHGLVLQLNAAQGSNPNAALPGGFTDTAFGPVLHWRFPATMRTTPSIVTYNPSAANANIRLPTGNNGAAIDATVTVSPDSSTSDSGVTFVGAGATALVFASTKNMVGYLHATASAEL